jgi:hypothetical protein
VGEPLAATVSQSRVYSFSLKKKADSSHMVSSKKQHHPKLDLPVPRTGNVIFFFEFNFNFLHLGLLRYFMASLIIDLDL